jgi:2-amino-4-hydroxy-6-hydroxymethyldihydropteridine diphosphokinase
VRASFAAAAAQLERSLGALRRSSLWRTEPVSPIPQPPYLNAVLVGRTSQPPESLLEIALAAERALGRHRRRRGPRNAPRPIDVDVLFLGEEVRHGPSLDLPHPRLRERRFVLAPLVELLPDHPLPPDGATAAELLARLPVRPWAERLGDFPALAGGGA